VKKEGSFCNFMPRYKTIFTSSKYPSFFLNINFLTASHMYICHVHENFTLIMEMLVSNHQKENLIGVLRTSYNIYNSIGFIGFCVIYNNKKLIQANLLLFEGLPVQSLVNQRQDTGKSYPLNTSDLEILNDLMNIALPSFKENGIKYIAHNDNIIYNIE
jgi:hypothetical protein